jgi:hypothetical protein
MTSTEDMRPAVPKHDASPQGHGAFNILLLHLNRPQLVALRLERQALDIERQRLQLLQVEIEQGEQTIRILQQYINFLLRLGAGKRSPEDD